MNKARIAISVMAVLMLAYVGYKNFHIQKDFTVLTPGSFYRGDESGGNMNPKEYYQQLIGVAFAEDDEESCKPEIVASTKLLKVDSVGGKYLPLEYVGEEVSSSSTPDELAAFIGGDCSSIIEDGAVLVCPVNPAPTLLGDFLNSNMKNSSIATGVSTTNIEIALSDTMLLRYENVKCWWCHNYDPSIVSHDKVVGHNSDYEDISVGDVVGTANADTKICLYRIPEDIAAQGTTLDKIKSLDSLEQLDLGQYLAKSELVPYVEPVTPS